MFNEKRENLLLESPDEKEVDCTAKLWLATMVFIFYKEGLGDS
jgi:hypothetical protein